MSSFTNDLFISSIRGSDNWKRVERSFRYYPIDKHVGPYILVPKGFVSDGATIPRFLWPVVGHPWSGKYDQAAVLHDLLYRRVGWIVVFNEFDYYSTFEYDKIIKPYSFDGPILIKLTREYVDKLFYEACKVLKVSFWDANLLYSGVRGFGWYPWKQHEREWLKKNTCPLYWLNRLGYKAKEVV